MSSVSRSFYDNGWRGIHVEPTTHYAQKIRANRPDEETFQVAIGHGGSEIVFYEVPETGLSTGDAAIADTHRRNGFKVVETTVPLLPLSQLFEQVGKREIHWLKIDVEGMEQSVIESWDPSDAKPWILAVESTLPNSQTPSHEGWEPLLLQRGYQYVYFDGLSRYYVSDDHPELAGVFWPWTQLL